MLSFYNHPQARQSSDGNDLEIKISNQIIGGLSVKSIRCKAKHLRAIPVIYDCTFQVMPAIILCNIVGAYDNDLWVFVLAGQGVGG